MGFCQKNFSLEKLAEGGDCRAQVQLALRYYHGEGVGKDIGHAVEWCRCAAEQGNADAQYGLGMMFYLGDVGVISYEDEQGRIKRFVDLSEALRWLAAASAQGHPQAERDFQKLQQRWSLPIALDAARQNYPRAFFVLGTLYETGEGVPRNSRKALEYYRAAVTAGFLLAKPAVIHMIIRIEAEIGNTEEATGLLIAFFEVPTRVDAVLRVNKYGSQRDLLRQAFIDGLGEDAFPSIAPAELRKLLAILDLSSGVLIDWIKTDYANRREFLTLLNFPAQVELVSQLDALGDLRELIKQSSPDLSSLASRVIERIALALDIESDGERIFQIGIADPAPYRLYDVTVENSDNALTQIISTLDCRTQKHLLLVGHNLLDWDLEVLRRHWGNKILLQRPVWDTLLVDWMLEPWKSSHALLVAPKSHQAEHDARSALELFAKQWKQFPSTTLSRLLYLEDATSTTVFNVLAEALQDVDGRRLPSPPKGVGRFDKIGADAYLAVPEVLLSQFAWVPGVRFYADDALRQDDLKTLVSERLQALVKQHADNPALVVVAAIVAKAARCGVQVWLRMIPLWLRERDDLSKSLIDCAEALTKENEAEFGLADGPHPLRIKTYRDLFTHRGSALFGSTAGTDIADCYLPHVGHLEAEHRQNFGEHELRKCLTGFNYRPGTGRYPRWVLTEEEVQRLTRNRRGIDPQSSWFLCRSERSYRSSSVQRPWALVEVLAPEKIRNDLEAPPLSKKSPFLLPRWQTPPLAPFLWPSAMDRGEYLTQLLERLYAVIRTEPADHRFVLLVQRHEETERLEQALEQLGLSLPRRPHESRLRWLERVDKTGRQCLVDHVDQALRWPELAKLVGVSLTLIVEALPLVDWWPRLPAELRDAASAESGQEKESVDASDENAEPEAASADDHSAITLASNWLREEQLLQALDDLLTHFLAPWYLMLVGPDADSPVIILDLRLSRLSSDSRALVRFKALHFTALQEDLRHRLRDAISPPEERDRRPPPVDYESHRVFFEKYWGHPDFKKSQRAVLPTILARAGDVLATLPTGEGKSVLFQVPALLRGRYTQRLTLVISPLRALMKDQVEQLHRRGNAFGDFEDTVDYLSGDRSRFMNETVLQGIVDGSIRLLYIAPERILQSPRFLAALHQRVNRDGGLDWVIFDEAHCLIHWGFDFRPDYPRALELLRRHFRQDGINSSVPFLFFTATATNLVARDLERLQNSGTHWPLHRRPDHADDPVRPHIRLMVSQVAEPFYGRDKRWGLEGRKEEVLKIVRQALQVQSTSGQRSAVVVFAIRRDDTEQLAFILRSELSKHVRVGYFHAGRSSAERLMVYEAFRNSEIQVLVATKAFGMGMDIPDIHWCVHLTPPLNLEDYLQEVGRTGRGDKEREKAGLEQVEARLLHHPTDFEWNHERIKDQQITLPELSTLWSIILEHADKKEIRGGFAILAEDATDMRGDRLRMALFWLERFDRVGEVRRVPGVVELTFNPGKLKIWAKKNEDGGRIARVLLDCIPDLIADPELSLSANKKDPFEGEATNAADLGMPAGDGLLSSIGKWLSKTVGLIFGGTSPPTQRPTPTRSFLPVGNGSEFSASAKRGLLPRGALVLEALWRTSELPRLDDVYVALGILAADGSITIERKLKIELQQDAEKAHELLDITAFRTQDLWRRLVRQLGRPLDMNDLEAAADAALDQEGVDNTLSLDTDADHRVERAVRFLLRGAGVEYAESWNTGGQLRRNLCLPRRCAHWGKARIEGVLYLAREACKVLSGASHQQTGSFRVAWSDLAALLHTSPTTVRFHDLETALALIERLRLKFSGQKWPSGQ